MGTLYLAVDDHKLGHTNLKKKNSYLIVVSQCPMTFSKSHHKIEMSFTKSNLTV